MHLCSSLTHLRIQTPPDRIEFFWVPIPSEKKLGMDRDNISFLGHTNWILRVIQTHYTKHDNMHSQHHAHNLENLSPNLIQLHRNREKWCKEVGSQIQFVSITVNHDINDHVCPLGRHGGLSCLLLSCYLNIDSENKVWEGTWDMIWKKWC